MLLSPPGNWGEFRVNGHTPPRTSYLLSRNSCQDAKKTAWGHSVELDQYRFLNVDYSSEEIDLKPDSMREDELKAKKKHTRDMAGVHAVCHGLIMEEQLAQHTVSTRTL